MFGNVSGILGGYWGDVGGMLGGCRGETGGMLGWCSGGVGRDAPPLSLAQVATLRRSDRIGWGAGMQGSKVQKVQRVARSSATDCDCPQPGTPLLLPQTDV